MLSFIVLFKVDKNLKLSFYSTVLRFCLAICPRVKGGKEPLFDIKKIAKQWPELKSEKQTFISYYSIR